MRAIRLNHSSYAGGSIPAKGFVSRGWVALNQWRSASLYTKSMGGWVADHHTRSPEPTTTSASASRPERGYRNFGIDAVSMAWKALSSSARTSTASHLLSIAYRYCLPYDLW